MMTFSMILSLRLPAARTTSDLMRTDAKDDGTNYLMEMELPGFKKEEIQAELKDGYLTIATLQR